MLDLNKKKLIIGECRRNNNIKRANRFIYSYKKKKTKWLSALAGASAWCVTRRLNKQS